MTIRANQITKVNEITKVIKIKIKEITRMIIMMITIETTTREVEKLLN